MLLHKGAPLSPGRHGEGKGVFQTEELTKYKLSFPHKKKGVFDFIHLGLAAVLPVSFLVSENVIHRKRTEGGGRGEGRGAHVCVCVVLKGPLPWLPECGHSSAALSRHFLCSDPAASCQIRSVEVQDVCNEVFPATRLARCRALTCLAEDRAPL